MGKKKKNIKNKKDTGEVENRFFYYLTLCSLVFLLFYPPYFRGLFFQVEQQWTLLLGSFVFIFCAVWKASRREVSFLNDYFDYAMIALFLIFIISCFVAADLRLAVAEVVKIALYFTVFWVISQLAVKKEVPLVIMSTIYASGLGVALVGFLCAVGAVEIKDGFSGNRIFSTLQYPNALAIYMAAVVIFGFYLWIVSNKNIKPFISSGNVLLLMIFFSTNSRGSFLVFPVMLLIFLIGLPREYRLKWFGHVVFLSLLGLAVSGKVIPAAIQGEMGTAWKWFVLGLLGAAIVQWAASTVYELIQRRFGEIRGWKAAAAAAIIFIVISGAWVGYSHFEGVQTAAEASEEETAWYDAIVPQHIASRIESISFENRSLQVRVYWTLQAFDLVKNSPVIGMGGGAWEAAYRSFQDYEFTSTQVHNHFLQLWAEVGTVGFAIYIFLWVMFIITSLRNYLSREDSRTKALDLTIFTAALGLGIHSFIDFDLALGAVALVLYLCFGLARGLDKQRREQYLYLPKNQNLNRKFLVFTGALAVVFLLLPGSLLIAHSYAQDGVENARSGNLDKAEANFKKAAVFDPFSSDHRVNLASIKNAQGSTEKAVKYMERAVSRSQYDARGHINLAKLYLRNGDLENALAEAKNAGEDSPWVLNIYNDITDIYFSVGMTYLQDGKKTEAKDSFELCSTLPERLEEQVKNMPGRAKDLWDKEKKFLNLNNGIKLNVGKSLYLLGQYEEAEQYLEGALGGDTEQEAHQWLAAAATKLDKDSKADEHLNSLEDAKLLENYEALVQMPQLND